MKYKIGDFVTLPKVKPEDNQNIGTPGWNHRMNSLLGKTLPISRSNPNSSPPSYYILNWWWSEHWLNPSTVSLEERICNKIKQLDTKWKERDSKFA